MIIVKSYFFAFFDCELFFKFFLFCFALINSLSDSLDRLTLLQCIPYGITIGTELIETDSKIVDDIPEHLKGDENDVEDGCGKCSAETCVMTNALPCMACKHFITTTKHEVFFKKAIENVNRLIETTKNRHDKEDLVTIKELYVLYLKAIIKHKEGITND